MTEIGVELERIVDEEKLMEINKKALKILLNYSSYEPLNKASKEEIAFAKDAGYMFDKIEQTHYEAMEYAFHEFGKCDKEHMTNLFLSSLSSARSDWRAGLSVYAIMRVFPSHTLKSNGVNCLICPTRDKEVVDFSTINRTRFAKGSISNGSLHEMAFMLKLHNQLPDAKPTKKDFKILKDIIEVVKCAESNDGPSKMQGILRSIEGFKSSKYQNQGLLETFGLCGILETEKNKGFLHQYVNLGAAPKFRHSSYWLYPVDWWKGKDGVNNEALEYWFGEYEELKNLFS